MPPQRGEAGCVFGRYRDYMWTTNLGGAWRRNGFRGAIGTACLLPGEHLPRPPAQATIRTRTRRLPLACAAPNERRSRDETHLRASATACWARYRGHSHLRSRLLHWMGLEIRGQRPHDSARGFAARRSLRVDRQAGDVSAIDARVLSFEHDWIMRGHHSTPASRRMRFPSRPASCPCTVTQTSLPLSG